MQVSVIIRTKNSAKTIRQVLDRYKSQSMKPLELILVDNVSIDNTRTIAQEYGCKIVSYSTEPYNHARACNMGMHLAKGDIVILTNGHTFPISNTWLEDGVRHFSDKRVTGVAGNMLPDKTRASIWEMKRFHYFSWLLHSKRIRKYSDANFWNFGMFYTYAGALRKEVWIREPFDEEYSKRRGMGEDVLWALNLASSGHTFIIDPQFSVFHSHGEGLVELLRSQYMYGKNYFHVYFTYVLNKQFHSTDS